MNKLSNLFDLIPALLLTSFTVVRNIGEIYHSKTEGAGIKIFLLVLLTAAAVIACKVMIPAFVFWAGLKGCLATAVKLLLAKGVSLFCYRLRKLIIKAGDIP
ncbi:MAG: hypothetical protein E7B29_03100 [Mixta calida]|uniref:hypothetical protein n=1 Tax=Mixta calida TaxID=665913 RepID=UPI0028FE0E16|nr:hypothetical protein [Mixta calida]